jgi:glucosamine-6-phosphate deaminase
MKTLVMPDYRGLSERAAELVAEAITLRPEATLGLPTGRTPLGMYRDLVRRHTGEGLDFSRVRTFNLDEYCGLGSQHPQSYHTYMRVQFLSRVNLPPNQADIPDGLASDLDAECERYESAIQNAGGLDLLIAGIGANGHIAFNEPGSSFTSRTRVVTLAQDTILRAAMGFSDEEVPRQAITMGIGTILEARRIMVLASGIEKARAVQLALKGPVSEAVPASALQRHPHVIAIVDEAAYRQ